jgi:hypothetical protein
MTEEPSPQSADDTVASALSNLATAVAGLADWHRIRDWALKGAADNNIPPELSDLESYRAVSAAAVADERLGALVNEESAERPIVRVGLFGAQLRASVLPAGMIASAIERCCLREPYADRPAPDVLRAVLAENLSVLRRIAARKTVSLPCLAGARGVRLRPGQASLETVLGSLLSKDTYHVPRLAMTGNPDVLITTTVRAQVQVLQHSDSTWGTDDPGAEAAKQRLSHLRLALLMGSEKAVRADVPDWTRTTVTGFALLMPFTAVPGWQIVTSSGEPAGRDPSPAEQASWVEVARDLSALNLDNVQVAIDRFLLAATERTSAADALVDAVVSLDALFGSPAEARLRVGAAVAWLLERDAAEARAQLFKTVGEIYAARSNAVHGSRASRRAGEATVLDALRLALRVLSATCYSSPWLLETPKSADRGLALILGNQDQGCLPGDQPAPPGDAAVS